MILANESQLRLMLAHSLQRGLAAQPATSRRGRTAARR